jgi:hypothetical protein
MNNLFTLVGIIAIILTAIFSTSNGDKKNYPYETAGIAHSVATQEESILRATAVIQPEEIPLTAESEATRKGDSYTEIPGDIPAELKILCQKGREERISNYLESSLDKSIREYAYALYPWTDSTKKLFDDKVVINITCNKDRAGGRYYYSKSIGQKKGLIIIANEPDGGKTAHEFFHVFIRETERINDEKWVDRFEKEWDEAKKSHARRVLEKIDADIDESGIYKNIRESDQKSRLASEHFAYLGERLGMNGLDAFPEKLRPFYTDVLESSPITETEQLPTLLEFLEERLLETPKPPIRSVVFIFQNFLL